MNILITRGNTLNKITWIIFSATAVGILALLVAFSSGSKINVSTINTKYIQAASEQNGNIADHVFGKAGSAVTLIEYGDFQCPGCGQAHVKVREITEKYKDQLQFVFRNYPLTTIHANSKSAASAVEASGLQGKYWEMHNKIFESQSSWNTLSVSDRTDLFVKYADELGLNTKQFTADMASTNVAQKISYDVAIGKKDEVAGTPTFILNGVTLEQSTWGDATKLQEAIDAELKKANIALPN